ncbi:Rha family transcriptional regulator [Campylobacter hyointestinalis]|uniref:Rha family transcriptional regulator n=2 Tax=Campylobacter hyointestinalis TaxID=198 RepID=UPI0007277170|nr:Rha family transcriptional regulator [Campylobacter hyointestinalis]CUU80012.1 phage anti-repressor protein [Campylobacter hyointestinalis subsp. hyointestinalis]
MSALITINNINVAFEVVNGEVFATSHQIAEVFDKGHHNILRLISNLPNDEFFMQNFQESFYINKQNKRQPCYNLTRDGFSLLVMGFTGQKAYRWKIEFIKAFNKMEAMIKAAKHNDLNLQSKFTEILSALKEKSNEADEYKAKYYESLENEVVLLRQVAKQSKKETIYNTKLSTAEKENIIKLYKSGLSQAEICRQTSRSDAAVRNAIRSAL